MLDKLKRWIRFNLLYLGKPPWDTGISPPELIQFLDVAETGCALDLGCGPGTNLLTMAESGWKVIGVDIAWFPVIRARAKLQKAGFISRVIHGNVASNLDLPVEFNLVLDIGCYHSLSAAERVAYRDNLASWLAPGGTFLLYAHLRVTEGDSHGFSDEDLAAFQIFLDLQWQVKDDEKRPDGGGGFPTTWVRFDRKDSNTNHPENNYRNCGFTGSDG